MQICNLTKIQIMLLRECQKAEKKLGIELEADSLFGAMRDATKEEQESVEKIY